MLATPLWRVARGIPLFADSEGRAGALSRKARRHERVMYPEPLLRSLGTLALAFGRLTVRGFFLSQQYLQEDFYSSLQVRAAYAFVWSCAGAGYRESIL